MDIRNSPTTSSYGLPSKTEGNMLSGSVGSASTRLRESARMVFQGALDDLLEVIECKVTDEEVRALAKRVERAR